MHVIVAEWATYEERQSGKLVGGEGIYHDDKSRDEHSGDRIEHEMPKPETRRV